MSRSALTTRLSRHLAIFLTRGDPGNECRWRGGYRAVVWLRRQDEEWWMRQRNSLLHALLLLMQRGLHIRMSQLLSRVGNCIAVWLLHR